MPSSIQAQPITESGKTRHYSASDIAEPSVNTQLIEINRAQGDMLKRLQKIFEEYQEAHSCHDSALNLTLATLAVALDTQVAELHAVQHLSGIKIVEQLELEVQAVRQRAEALQTHAENRMASSLQIWQTALNKEQRNLHLTLQAAVDSGIQEASRIRRKGAEDAARIENAARVEVASIQCAAKAEAILISKEAELELRLAKERTARTKLASLDVSSPPGTRPGVLKCPSSPGQAVLVPLTPPKTAAERAEDEENLRQLQLKIARVERLRAEVENKAQLEQCVVVSPVPVNEATSVSPMGPKAHGVMNLRVSQMGVTEDSPQTEWR